MIYVKSNKEIIGIKKACVIWKEVRQALKDATKVGISTIELDNIAQDVINKHNAIPTFLNYGGFPRNICISINDELIHGIPSKRIIKDKDMITFDVGVTYDGYVCDSAFTIIVGKNIEAQKISDAAYEALMETINLIAPGVHTGDLGRKTESIAQAHGYEVIKDFSGHGCGKKLHEDPQIFNFGKNGNGTKLVSGMTICIEPMLFTGSDQYYIEPNDWTVVSKNHKLTCHWEHMVLVTENGYEILTI
ncbi:MAG: type I methionyl aminopeptidase [Mycoplasmataceae bacterium]|nr:type I methionyl aminopeptidase [Mycoplasmataceae bacterium]